MTPRYAAPAMLAGLFLIASCATPQGAPETAAERIRQDVAWLADDAREGREAGEPGYAAAAAYVESEFRKAGLKPGVGKGWRQSVPMVAARRVITSGSLKLDGVAGDTTLVNLDDFLVARLRKDASFSATGSLVFVGHGVVAPEDGVDDYAGLDVKGKIVIAFGGAPTLLGSEKGAHYSSTEVKFETAAARGAVGFMSIPTKHDAASSPWQDAVHSADSSVMTSIGADGAPHIYAPEIRASAFLSEAGAAKLFAAEKKSFAALQAEAESGAPMKGFALAKSATLAGESALEEKRSDNVIGLIEGSDPLLRDEVILLTAHLDHVGIRKPKEPGGDAINNGALDNAIGVSLLIEAAGELRRSGVRPKRTIAFAALTAEEKGLVGSNYLARNPAFGDRKIVANVNLDMPVLLYPFTDVIAFGGERSSLGATVASAARAIGVKLSPDPIPEENIFVRSDHYSFVKTGVPAVMLMTGFENGGEAAFRGFLKDHYHKPSDEIDLPIDYEAAARFAALNVEIARKVADAPAPPQWNEGDFFGQLYKRKQPLP
jgi:Zn-dependent M28 family amino/carboxypeptidase